MSETIKISPKVITSIYSSSLRTDGEQKRMYGILFGTKTYTSYYIKDCLLGAMTECIKKEGESNEFQTPARAQTETLIESYLSTHPSESVLGGFTTDNELFSELTILNFVINKIPSDRFSVHNDLVLLYDTMTNKLKPSESTLKIYKWKKDIVNSKFKKDDDLLLVSFEQKPWEIYEDKEYMIIGKDVINPEKLYYTLDDWEIEADKEIEKIISDFAEKDNSHFIGKDIKEGVKDKVEYIKRELYLCIQYLTKFDKILNHICNKSELTDIECNIVDKILYVVSSLKDTFDLEDVQNVIQVDVQRNKILDALVSIQNAQIKITEKINFINFAE